MKFTWFIGIDVSKKTLDIAVIKSGEIVLSTKIENSTKEFTRFVNELSDVGINITQTLFCMEHTGVYCMPIMECTEKLHLALWLENAAQIKYSIGVQRGKNDKIDAIRIAEYADRYIDRAKLYKPTRNVIQQLKSLTRIRRTLLNHYNALKTMGKEKDLFLTKGFHINTCSKSIKALELNIKEVDLKIKKIIMDDENVKRLFEIITSVKGVGAVVGAEIIVATNEFKNFDNPKKFACYAGLAPFEYSSGSSIKRRVRISKNANMTIKKLIHMSAICALRHNKELKEYYERKVAQGKSKMSVVNVLRNKLIQRVFACVRDDRKYEYIYSI